jgi:hypothetical protein
VVYLALAADAADAADAAVLVAIGAAIVSASARSRTGFHGGAGAGKSQHQREYLS